MSHPPEVGQQSNVERCGSPVTGATNAPGAAISENYEYTYLTINDAVVAMGQLVNIYGKIVEFDQPRHSRGSDITCTMTLRDMSYPMGLRVIVFASTLDLIPRVRAVGDVIRFHRVKMTVHSNAPQAIAKIQKSAQFLLFSGKIDDSTDPYQQSSMKYTKGDVDINRLTLFRNWHDLLPAEPASSNLYKMPIKGLKHGCFFDICCQMLLIVGGEDDAGFIIYVWDGTDAPPAPIGISPGDEELPKAASPPRETLFAFPPKGTVLPLVPDAPEQKLPLQLPDAGNWVLFRNLKCRVWNGVYGGIWTRESKLIRRLDPDSPSVTECMRVYAERFDQVSQWAPVPLQSMTVTDHENVRLSTLREVLVHPQVTYKFRCLVRVVSTFPCDFVDFCGMVPDETGNDRCCGTSQYVYAVRLTLEDPTARLQAYLCGEDAVQFFNGHPARDLHSQGATVGALERNVKRLLGVSDNDWRNPPWIKCCLKSYYLDKQHQWHTRRFRIFGTTLPG